MESPQEEWLATSPLALSQASPPNSPPVSPLSTLTLNSQSPTTEIRSPCAFLETTDFTSQTDFDSFFSDQAVQTLDGNVDDSSNICMRNSSEKGETADFTAQTNFDFFFSNQAIQTKDIALHDDTDHLTAIDATSGEPHVNDGIHATSLLKCKRKIKDARYPKPKKAAVRRRRRRRRPDPAILSS